VRRVLAGDSLSKSAGFDISSSSKAELNSTSADKKDDRYRFLPVNLT